LTGERIISVEGLGVEGLGVRRIEVDGKSGGEGRGVEEVNAEGRRRLRLMDRGSVTVKRIVSEGSGERRGGDEWQACGDGSAAGDGRARIGVEEVSAEGRRRRRRPIANRDRILDSLESISGHFRDLEHVWDETVGAETETLGAVHENGLGIVQLALWRKAEEKSRRVARRVGEPGGDGGGEEGGDDRETEARGAGRGGRWRRSLVEEHGSDGVVQAGVRGGDLAGAEIRVVDVLVV
jgi:hypothetical protein